MRAGAVVAASAPARGPPGGLHGDARRRRHLRAAAVAVAVGLCAVVASRQGHRIASPRSLDTGSEALSSEPVALFEDLEERPDIHAKLSGGWQFCSPGGATCRCLGTARFHTWTGDWAMLRHVSGEIDCTVEGFGEDPRPHFPKMCSCTPGLDWPQEVMDGLNGTIARKLVARVDLAPRGSGCNPEDDRAWTPCAVLSTRFDSSLIPDRYLPLISPEEQQDAALRKLDECARIAGPDMAMRVLGVPPGKGIVENLVPVRSTSAPVCAVVYAPEAGVQWDARKAVFCPSTPPHCVEGDCECASPDHRRINVNTKEDVPDCWACISEEKLKEEEAEAAKAKAEGRAEPETGAEREAEEQEQAEDQAEEEAAAPEAEPAAEAEAAPAQRSV